MKATLTLILALLTSSSCIAKKKLKQRSHPERETILHNGDSFPLLGLGVGNLQHELIPMIVQEGIQYGLRMIDTAHASRNEAIIANAIESSDHETIHIVTKVWYTYLGYERTKHSIHESIEAVSLKSSTSSRANVKIHMLLHWPRCRNDIPWMDCEGEEESLPDDVKQLGPPPHLSPETAYLDSWRAMEDMYSENALASIGVSNFDIHDLQTLLANARIVPHIIQLNVWSFLFDPQLIAVCREHYIHIQVYNVMNGIFGRADELSPNAKHSLETIRTTMTAPQLVLAWLVHQDVSVIPRTTRHVQDNAKVTSSTTTLLLLSDDQMQSIRTAVAVMLQGRDLDLPKATFVSNHSVPVSVFWKHHESVEELSVRTDLQPGESFHSDTYPGHVFVVYESDDTPRRKEFQITAGFGDEEQIHMEL